MKLLNQSLAYLIVSILAIISVWGVFFYFNLLREIKSSMDEGLENYKRVIVQNAKKDSSLLHKPYFDESFFTITPISREDAANYLDSYKDTVLYMQDADDQAPEVEPVRMLSTSFEVNGNFYELQVANSMVEEDDLIQELLDDVMWLFVVLILGVFVINNWVLRSVWKPFYKLLAELKQYRIGSGNELPQSDTKTKEFVDLQQAINALVQRGNVAFEQQKEFIGNASHELQTPLAVAMGKLELLLEKSELNEPALEKIGEIYQVIQQMISLNRSLLLLSKIENRQYLKNQLVDLHQVASVILENFEELIEFKNLQVTINSKVGLSVTMDPDLAKILLSNLIKNAIYHNREDGEITLTISGGQLTVSNTGGHATLDPDQIFERFHRSHTKAEGTGLGLAICRAIAELYGIRLSYQFTEGQHCFVLDFQQVR